MRKPPPQAAAAMVPTTRGPISSSHRPAKAADRPRQTIATMNTRTTAWRVQSSPELSTTPLRRVSDALKMLQAYTEPMHRWIAIEAGGTRQRLKPSGATIASRENRLAAAAPGRRRSPPSADGTLSAQASRRWASRRWNRPGSA